MIWFVFCCGLTKVKTLPQILRDYFAGSVVITQMNQYKFVTIPDDIFKQVIHTEL